MNKNTQNRKIGVFGSEGSFTHIAAIKYFNENKFKHFENAYLLLLGLSEENIELAVLPLSNNMVGTVEANRQLLSGFDYEEVDRITLPINLFLYKKKGAGPKITRIVSHPHALMQCSKYINTNHHSAKMINDSSTSHAAIHLAHGKYSDNTAVICSELSGDINGLQKIDSNIEDSPKNRTTFIIIAIKK